MNKAVFLDRDGVINHDIGYASRPEDFAFIDGVFEACKRFQAQGFLLVIVTNQSGIARGYYTEADFQHLTEWMLKEFERHGVNIAGVYYCPHHPDAGKGKYLQNCNCRKPEPGMLYSAAKELNIDLSQSVIIGDKLTDIQAGENAGVKAGILIEKNNEYADLRGKISIYSKLADVVVS